ncbi:MAG: hypothetical protein IPG97_09125 [Microthrixaceae bacterium]|nr:hypothetical protein [Microthrixaceae bacterium]
MNTYLQKVTIGGDRAACDREWRRVDVALDTNAQQAVQTGLDSSDENHRKIYVGLTRASHATRVRGA